MWVCSSFLTVLLIAAPNASAANQTQRPNSRSAQVPKHVPTVTFCELVRHPVRYDGKIVRLRVKYLVGGETRVVYDKRCEGEAWVEFDHVFDTCTEKNVRERFGLRAPSPSAALFNYFGNRKLSLFECLPKANQASVI